MFGYLDITFILHNIHYTNLLAYWWVLLALVALAILVFDTDPPKGQCRPHYH